MGQTGVGCLGWDAWGGRLGVGCLGWEAWGGMLGVGRALGGGRGGGGPGGGGPNWGGMLGVGFNSAFSAVGAPVSTSQCLARNL
jgi:hypothetical protein